MLVQSSTTVGVVSSHRGIATTLITALISECGAPRGRDVVVLDAWPLPPAP